MKFSKLMAIFYVTVSLFSSFLFTPIVSANNSENDFRPLNEIFPEIDVENFEKYNYLLWEKDDFDSEKIEKKNFQSITEIFPEIDVKHFEKYNYLLSDGSNLGLQLSPLSTSFKIVSIQRVYGLPHKIPNSIYYDQDGYYGYIPLMTSYRDENYPIYIAIFGGAVMKKGPGDLDK